MKVVFIRNVLPGDEIPENGIKSFGIHDNKSTIAGQLCRIENLYFIRSKTSKYVPTKYDIAVGKVIYTSSEYYKLDLGNVYGVLPLLAFPNASKKNRPEVRKGNFVLCQVVLVEPEVLLNCNHVGLGVIEEAHWISTWKARHLYFSSYLQELGKRFNFKIAIAMNGYLWIDAEAREKREILKYLVE